MGRSYVHFAIAYPAYFHIMGRPEFYSAADETFARGYQSFFDTMSEAAAAAWRETGVEGLDPQAFMISTWAMAHGLATLWLDGTLEDRIGPVDIEAVAAGAFDVVFSSSAVAAQMPEAHAEDRKGAGSRAAR
jgi:hypothetical protein